MKEKNIRSEEELRAIIRSYALYSPAQMRKDQARAEKMLRRLKSYDDWVASMSEEERTEWERQFAASTVFGGSLRGFYDMFVKELQEIRRNGSPTTYVFPRTVGRMGGKASAKSLTPQQRTERARKAGKARQAKAREAARDGGAK